MSNGFNFRYETLVCHNSRALCFFANMASQILLLSDTALINVMVIALQTLREEISGMKIYFMAQLEDLKKVKRSASCSHFKDDEAEEVVRLYNCVFPGCTWHRKRCRYYILACFVSLSLIWLHIFFCYLPTLQDHRGSRP
jgi:hypothetical protein